MRNLIKYTILAVNLLLIVVMTIGILCTRISPEQGWYGVALPYFGFAFPFLYIINLCFVIFWLCFRKWWFAIFNFVCLCVTFPYFNAEIPMIGHKHKADGKTISVMTYNVEFLGNGKRFDKIFKQIKDADADVVCLQEFGFYSKGKLNSTDVFAAFATIYPYRHLWYKNEFKNLKYGVVTFSKYPIVNKEKVQYKSKNNISILSDIVVEGDTLRVLNNHLESYRLTDNDMKNFESVKEEDALNVVSNLTNKMGRSYPIRARQAEEIAYIVHHSPYPTISVGDFNAIPTSYVYNKIKGNQEDLYVCTHKGFNYTWRLKWHNRTVARFRIDHILYSNGLHPISSNIIHSDNSDHDAIVGTLCIR